METNYKAGDILINKRFDNVEIEIVKRNKNYYLYKYTETEEILDSRNSSDPERCHWKLK